MPEEFNSPAVHLSSQLSPLFYFAFVIDFLTQFRNKYAS